MRMAVHDPTTCRTDALSPVLAFEDTKKLFWCDDGALGFGFQCQPLPGADDKTEARLRSFLDREWPADTIVQLLLVGSPNLVSWLETTRIVRQSSHDPLDIAAWERRAEMLNAAIAEPFSQIPNSHLRDFQILVTVKVPVANRPPSAPDLDDAGRLAQTVQSELEVIGLAPIPLTATTWVTHMNVLCNRDDVASWRHFGRVDVSGDKPLAAQFVDFGNEVEIERDYVRLGEGAYLAFMSPRTLPETLFFGQAAHMLYDLLQGSRGVRTPFYLAVNLHFPEDQKARTDVETKRAYAMHMADGTMTRWIPAILTRSRDWNLLHESLARGGRPVRVMMAFGVYGRSIDELQRHMAEVRAFASEQNFIFSDERRICLPLLINTLPFGAEVGVIGDLARYNTLSTEHAARLVPVFGDWKGTPTPVIQFVSRSGQYMTLDLFDSGTNYNAVIAAQSGSGKSFFANEIVAGYLACGGTVWTIDIGGSYKNLCESLGGEYIDFEAEGQICLNPFGLVRDFEEESEMLVTLVGAMAAPSEALSDFQRAELTRIIADLWEAHHHGLTVDHVADALRHSQDPRVMDIGAQLFQFTSRGAFGRYFIGKNTVTFENRFTVLELEGLRGQAQLQQIVLLQLIYQIQQSMYGGGRDRRKIVLIDEAWSLLTDGEVGRFIEHAYRRMRKYGGGAITVTQSVADLFQSEVGKAIADNSAHMFLLGQRPDAIDRVVASKQLPLTGLAVELLKSVRTVPGKYSEIFILTDAGQGIARLVVDPFSQLLYSTRPDDVARIQAAKRRGLSTVDAVSACLGEGPGRDRSGVPSVEA